MKLYNAVLVSDSDEASPPMRGRGLKPVKGITCVSSVRVAPHAGAWIETNR